MEEGEPSAFNCIITTVPQFIYLLVFLVVFGGIFCFDLELVHISRLFSMLRRFPIESKGRRKKLNEVCEFSSLNVEKL